MSTDITQADITHGEVDNGRLATLTIKARTIPVGVIEEASGPVRIGFFVSDRRAPAWRAPLDALLDDRPILITDIRAEPAGAGRASITLHAVRTA